MNSKITTTLFSKSSSVTENYLSLVRTVIERNEPVALVDSIRPEFVSCVLTPLDILEFVGEKVRKTHHESKTLDLIQGTSEPCHG
jgi:hypothetical protein